MRYAPDPAQHEQAVLELMKKRLAGATTLGDMDGTRVPTMVHDVRLEGRYPETKLVIEVSRGDMYSDRLEWELWGDRFGELPEGWTTTPPEEVAVQVMVQIYEF